MMWWTAPGADFSINASTPAARESMYSMCGRSVSYSNPMTC